MKNRRKSVTDLDSSSMSKKSVSKTTKLTSYKDSHSLGRRSSNVITYSENSNLYFDLFTKCGVYNAAAFQYYDIDSSNKPTKSPQKSLKPQRSSLPASVNISKCPKKRLASLNARAIMSAFSTKCPPIKKEKPSPKTIEKNVNSDKSLQNIPLILEGETIYSKLTKKNSNFKVNMKVRKDTSKINSDNIWNWVGESFDKLVFTSDNISPIRRKCYSAIQHSVDGIIIKDKENVLICSDNRSLPHVARITSLYQDESTNEMKFSLLWYYRPEAIKTKSKVDTSHSALNNSLPNELFASRHADSISIDCIEDRAYVFPLNVYNRFMANEKHRRETKLERDKSPSENLNNSTEEFPDDATEVNVFICRGVYDLKSKRVVSNPVHVTYPFGPHSPLKNTSLCQSHQAINSTPNKNDRKRKENSEDLPIIPEDFYAKYSRKNNTNLDSSNIEDLSINWGEHGEKIALSLKSKRSPSTSSKNKSQNRSAQKILVL